MKGRGRRVPVSVDLGFSDVKVVGVLSCQTLGQYVNAKKETLLKESTRRCRQGLETVKD